MDTVEPRVRMGGMLPQKVGESLFKWQRRSWPAQSPLHNLSSSCQTSRMRHILTSAVLLVFLFPAVALGQEVGWDDLVSRNGLYYKKSTDVPFTGEVTGRSQGRIKDGKRDGPWVHYHTNGQLWSEETYKDGKRGGPYVIYYDNGQLWEEGTYKNGEKDGPWVYYHDNGQLSDKGTWKDGEWDGPWVVYKKDGTVVGWMTGTYKNGVKVE